MYQTAVYEAAKTLTLMNQAVLKDLEQRGNCKAKALGSDQVILPLFAFLITKNGHLEDTKNTNTTK